MAMPLLTYTEENYLKTIYALQYREDKGEVSVNEIAERMQTRPATVTDMMRKLSEKELIEYQKYKKLKLSGTGLKVALEIVRKHRLWETFLHDKLHFSWDEVHEVAEQLEHIQSQQLIDKLDEFLGHPKFDPHGDPIPDAKGEMPAASTLSLADAKLNKSYMIVAVKDTSVPFLHQLEKMNLAIGSTLSVVERMPFDNSNLIKTSKDHQLMLSEKIAMNILVKSA
ncbi:MAG TPA: metal-dependent transcriptional regulator [Flavipsychrobacter sp.]|nr:metal-dependent transcriptional regulator [Flavipsychrobacter sp.]